MYGTVAKFKVQPGKLDEIGAVMEDRAKDIPGLRFEYVFQTDNNPNELILVVGFDSKEAYQKNAESPEQHEHYVRYRTLMTADPEWMALCLKPLSTALS